jgi:DNA-binding transcriptional regulator YiaG
MSRERLVGAEHSLMLGPVAMARAMGVPYDTYKNWKSERTVMPAVATRCLDLLIEHPKAARALSNKT